MVRRCVVISLSGFRWRFRKFHLGSHRFTIDGGAGEFEAPLPDFSEGMRIALGVQHTNVVVELFVGSAQRDRALLRLSARKNRGFTALWDGRGLVGDHPLQNVHRDGGGASKNVIRAAPQFERLLGIDRSAIEFLRHPQRAEFGSPKTAAEEILQRTSAAAERYVSHMKANALVRFEDGLRHDE